MLRYTLSLFFCLANVLAIKADPIGKVEAALIASQYVPGADSPRLVHAAKRTVRRADAATRAGVDDDSAPLYIFSRGAGKGYVIVAGDNCVDPVIGVVDSGDFDAGSLPPALADMLQGWAELIENAQLAGAPARRTARKAAGTRDVPELLTTHWHQSSPYNDKCPYLSGTKDRAATGCVATAAAQVAYYWRNDAFSEVQYDTPTYGYGDAPVTEEFRIKKGTPYNWNLMLDSYGGNTKQRDAVATLVATMGMSTWLTYGASTSGQIKDLVGSFGGQFNLSSTCWYKDGNSEASWEKLVVKELEAYQPIVYSGVHPTNGGHAVVLDGYRVKDNMFHFNFGWGGQGDGYYTLDDQTGVNGFSGQQGMTFQIKPKKYSLSATVKHGDFVQKADNRFTVQLCNNSSIPYSGVYLFISAGTPTIDIAKPTAKNIDVEVPKGGKAELTFSYKPSQKKPYIIAVADRNGRVLVRDTVQVVAAIPDLKLNSLKANDAQSAAVETIRVDDAEQSINVNTIYNTNVSISAELYNSPQGSVVQPTLKAELYTYDAAGGTWVAGPTKTLGTTLFGSDDTKTVVFQFNKLQEGVLYKARLQEKVLIDTYYYIDESTADSVSYFRVQAGDLEVARGDGATAYLSGAWNVPLFNALAQDGGVSVYDLSAVSHFGGDCRGVATANPNALLYAPCLPEAGANIVADGRALELHLAPGGDFTPRDDFMADRAAYEASGQTGMWTTVFLPFDVDSTSMPKDAVVRNVLQIQSGYIFACDSVCRSMSSCTPYMVVPGRETLRIESRNVQVSTKRENIFTTDFVGTFVSQPAVKNEMWVLDQGATQYFNTPTEETVQALTAYIVNATRKVRANSYPYSVKEQSTVRLAKAIIAAQQALDNSTDGSEYSVFVLQKAIENAVLVLWQQDSKQELDEAHRAIASAQRAFEADPGYVPLAVSAPVSGGNAVMYDLSGRKVGPSALGRGIYIVNGKKVVKP